MAGRAIHLPVWLGTVSRAQATPFIVLFSMVIFCRAMLSTILPLTASQVLGGAQSVSTLYFCASLFALCANLLIPGLVHRFRRRWVFTMGCVCLMAAPVLMAFGGTFGLVAGILLYFVSVATFEITLNLYMMDHIPVERFGKFEPLRMFFSGVFWVLGPWLGVFLMETIAPAVPFMLATTGALLLCGYFWLLRLRDDPAVRPLRGGVPNPFKNLGRFVAQPSLRIAWLLALGRSSFWVVFFVYGPLFAIELGLDPVKTGALISIGSMSLFLVPLWGWIGRRYGFRRLLTAGYLLTGLCSLAVTLAAGSMWGGLSTLIVATIAAGIIDGAGNMPFLKSVSPDERPEMTGVYTTYRDLGQLIPPGVFALLLAFFPLSTVFAAVGLVMLGMTLICRRLSPDL